MGCPPSSTPTLRCRLRAWRQDSRRETAGSACRSPRPPPHGFLVVCSWCSTLHVLLRKVVGYRGWGAEGGTGQGGKSRRGILKKGGQLGVKRGQKVSGIPGSGRGEEEEMGGETGGKRGRLVYLSLSLLGSSTSYVNPSLSQAQRGSSDKTSGLCPSGTGDLRSELQSWQGKLGVLFSKTQILVPGEQ